MRLRPNERQSFNEIELWDMLKRNDTSIIETLQQKGKPSKQITKILEALMARKFQKVLIDTKSYMSEVWRLSVMIRTKKTNT